MPLFDMTLPDVLRARARETPDRTFFQNVRGPKVSYAEAYRSACGAANGLVNLEVKPGEVVVIMAENSAESIAGWLGVHLAGAVEAAINTGYRGQPLVHALQTARARVMFAGESFLPAIAEVRDSLTYLETIVVFSSQPASSLAAVAPKNVKILTFGEVQGSRESDPLRHVKFSDVAAIVYTSGTTGPAKGVIMPHGHIALFARLGVEGARMTEDDVHYCFVPLYHVAGKYMGIFGSMMTGGSVIIDTKFTAEAWLPRVRQYKATLSHVHGPLVEMIYKQPESPDDADNPVTRIVSSPFPAKIAKDFERRFGLRGIECWGMTEVTVPIWQPYDEPLHVGCCGRVRDEHFEFRIVDPETDEESPVGQVGEFVLRAKRPWTIMQGYLHNPEATIVAWRNLWFHTGDHGYTDADGYVYFVDRGKERIRRRAENISSYDIEAAALLHAEVRECAAVGVPSEFEGDDDIKLCVIRQPNSELTAEQLMSHLAPRLPHFMAPRYIQFVTEFARTSVGKIQKASLRGPLDEASTWDRKKAGFKLREHVK
jgi:carnitine-CoA ligase